LDHTGSAPDIWIMFQVPASVSVKLGPWGIALPDLGPKQGTQDRGRLHRVDRWVPPCALPSVPSPTGSRTRSRTSQSLPHTLPPALSLPERARPAPPAASPHVPFRAETQGHGPERADATAGKVPGQLWATVGSNSGKDTGLLMCLPRHPSCQRTHQWEPGPVVVEDAVPEGLQFESRVVFCFSSQEQICELDATSFLLAVRCMPA
jgi:hypothetical protein